MKISRYFLLSIIIALVLFFIPFLWLKPGEMDLGGDNSRLYFYSPIGYLISQSLYSVTHSGFGAENLSYFAIPFFLLLAFVKSLVDSPTILISIFHGINLSLGFFFCYLTVRELLKNDSSQNSTPSFVHEISGILAGLYYSFSPNPIHWWGYPLLPMNVVFINPMMFYLMLRFFLTAKMKYLLLSLIVTFFFSPNFSYIGAPTFFSFFPLATLFLIIFTKYIKKKPIPTGKIILGLLLFVLIHSFHLIPQIMSILTPGSFANGFIFGDQGKLQWGLKYFMAIAPSIRVSNALLGILQYTPPEMYWWMYVIYPTLFVLGFLWTKSKTYCLTAVFFLITLFFVSANVTNLGFKLYALAFNLPGFSMFRVFYGQWQWSYLFFYTLFVGQALAIVLGKILPYKWKFFVLGLSMLFLATSWSFVTGKLTNSILWQSKDIKSHMQMDPEYEEVLSYIQALPVDGKILSFPLNDHGYQVVKGANDAAYVGPSTITYVAGRNEFTSAAELDIFGPSLLLAARQENYAMFKDILGVLNIKYIFHNKDQYIYEENFPAFPYLEIRKFFPGTQEGYEQFIHNLGVKEIKNFSNKYYIYEVLDEEYVPHIYGVTTAAYWGDMFAANAQIPLSFYPDTRVAFFEDPRMLSQEKEIFDSIFIHARNISSIFDFFRKKREERFVSPTVSRHFTSPIYPLIVFREQQNLKKYKTIDTAYIDRSIYFAEKRINELDILKNVPLKKKITSITDLASTWKEPKLWEIFKYNEYNSWEVTLARYENAMKKLINEIDQSNQGSYSNITSKLELKVYLKEHKLKLRNTLRFHPGLIEEDKVYLSSLIEGMFVDIYNSLNLELSDYSSIPFSIDQTLEDGIYEVYVRKEDVKDLSVRLDIDGKPISLVQESDEWLRFENIDVQGKKTLPITFNINKLPNLAAKTSWTTAEDVLYKDQFYSDEDSASLAIPYEFIGDTSGLIRPIPDWEGNSIYAISFDYLTEDQNFSVILHEKGGSKVHSFTNRAYEETIKSNTWRQFSIAMLSFKDANYASLQIMKSYDDNISKNKESVKKIKIKNLVVQKVYSPMIVLKKTQSKTISAAPQISFTQINPTRYSVTVRGAKDPYTLVFSQAFNNKWRLFLPDGEHRSKTLKGLIEGSIGAFLRTLTTIIMPGTNQRSTRTVVTHIGGSVSEGEHTKDFWSADSFDTWGLAAIAEKTHRPVNGYANGWHIKPEDTNLQKDYTLIIEMTSQKIFIGSLFLTGIGIVLIIILFLKSLITRR